MLVLENKRSKTFISFYSRISITSPDVLLQAIIMRDLKQFVGKFCKFENILLGFHFPETSQRSFVKIKPSQNCEITLSFY